MCLCGKRTRIKVCYALYFVAVLIVINVIKALHASTLQLELNGERENEAHITDVKAYCTPMYLGE